MLMEYPMDVAFLTCLLCLQAQQIRQLEGQFYTDDLTQVGNRAAFDRAMEQAWVSYCQGGQDFAVLYLDGNNIKAVNDTYGHATGDRVIAAIAASIRDQGMAFRLGGDEFALLLPGPALSEQRLQRLCQRIHHRVWQAGRQLQTQTPLFQRLQDAQQLPIVSVAMGWALASWADSLADLQMKADSAMYVSKWQSKRLADGLTPSYGGKAPSQGRGVPFSIGLDTDGASAVEFTQSVAAGIDPISSLKVFRQSGRAVASVTGSTPKTVLR